MPDQTIRGPYEVACIPGWFALSRPRAHASFRHWIAYGPPDQIEACKREGAADFLVEPWTSEELLARAAAAAAVFDRENVALENGILSGARGSVVLTPGERSVMEVLLRYSGCTVPREMISNNGTGRSVDVLVSRLRRKIKIVGGDETVRIRAIRGEGYRFQTDQNVERLWTTSVRRKS